MGTAVLVVGSIGLLATVNKFIDFLRMLANFATNKSGVITQLCAWVAGVVGVTLYAHSGGLGTGIAFGSVTLDKANGPALILIGMAVSSAASVVTDIKQAVDHTDSAVKPPLLKG